MNVFIERQRGFTLIEALVALTLLAVGLLGVAAMQLKAFNAAEQGYRDAHAHLAAIDAQERLWAAFAEHGGCYTIALSALEADWQRAWFYGNRNGSGEESNAPAALANGSGAMTRQGCRFDISIMPQASNVEPSTPLSYSVFLPDQLPLPGAP
ncbi:prepilin-type N-terminal cleavage/methylation domain-containing protein [Halomonas dongshanensis]|uniref:Prepilin-type N-terminal cleavage/methylation domain-containing protein n=1 Tax=Halomonas dongshanensis TaxID=2890835 RepID=A0ABT2EGV4_9GAMM|nr:prepilin-type N-terminal cleavage/methylation domain-containing protein [Halomonas dongshanensis]MCS2610827.1 prepilin-type N-terminal cleavage/methylation domain-containing protein [Halomonas dongshanensis]